MPRLRTAAAATLLVIPIVAGGFLLQDAPVRANATTYERAARGLVKELNDPYSELMSPKQSEDFSRGTNGRYGGTGMYIGTVKIDDQEVAVVDRVFPHTPAEEAGVREGDRIIAVDGVTAIGLKLDQVSDKLRGEPGSPVVVTYSRPGVAEPIKLKFIRRVVHVPAVAYNGMIADKVGYIPLQTFNENAADEVETA